MTRGSDGRTDIGRRAGPGHQPGRAGGSARRAGADGTVPRPDRAAIGRCAAPTRGASGAATRPAATATLRRPGHLLPGRPAAAGRLDRDSRSIDGGAGAGARIPHLHRKSLERAGASCHRSQSRADDRALRPGRPRAECAGARIDVEPGTLDGCAAGRSCSCYRRPARPTSPTRPCAVRARAVRDHENHAAIAVPAQCGPETAVVGETPSINSACATTAVPMPSASSSRMRPGRAEHSSGKKF